MQQAQAMARHTSINTMLVYSHNIDRVNNAGEFSIDKMLGMRDRPVRQADANSENASTTSAMRITVF